MAEAFDAYYVWLGIGPEEQPANHYRLLGIRVFEPNLEVIESAADRQMAHLRTFQQGKNAALSQRLLNEVSAARVCLLNPATKAAYDSQLRALQKPFPATGGAAVPRATRPDLPVASPLFATGDPGPAQAATNWDALIGSDAGPAAKTTSTHRLSPSTARPKSSNQLVYIISAAAILLAAGVGLVIYINGMEGEPAPHDAQAAKPVEPQTGKAGKTSAVANSQGAAQPVALPRGVNLTIDWPVADRQDGRLTIDGEDQLLDAINLEFPLAHGRHVIQLTRDGFEPIWQTLTVGSQALPPLALHWVPKAAVAAADEPTPTPVTPTPANGGDDAAATQPMRKLPIPSAAEQAQIAKRLDETLKAEHVGEKDHALAVQLFDTADGPGNSPAERYVLLTKAAELAAGAGDFELAFRRGIEALNVDYEIDPFEMKQRLLQDSLKSVAKSQQVGAIVATAEQVIEEALADDRYDTAFEIAAMATKAASNQHAEARFRTEATDRIGRRVREIEAIQKAAAVAIEANATLERSPDDAAANLTLGRWHCLYKRDWDRGLPLLAKGPDGPFKKLAQLELAGDLTLKPQLDLADGWWEVGQKESGLLRDSAYLHAGEIYRLQLPNLQGGLKKTSVEQRLKVIDSIGTSSGPKRQIDLLKLVDLKRDAVTGDWTVVNGGIASGSAQFFAELALPYEPPEEYDFEIEFSRISGNDAIGQICVGGPNQFLWLMSGWGGNVSGFDRVNDKDANAGPTRREFGIAGSSRHTSIVKVRKDSIQAWVDGRLVDEWNTDYRDMTIYPELAIPNRSGLALATHDSPTAFFSAKVTEIHGTGKLLSDSRSLPPPRAPRRTSRSSPR